MRRQIQKITSSKQRFSGDIFPQYKVITTQKTCDCLMCNEPIQKDTKVIVRIGTDDFGNMHFEPIHVDTTRKCIFNFTDILTENDNEDLEFILQTAAFLNRKEQ